MLASGMFLAAILPFAWGGFTRESAVPIPVNQADPPLVANGFQAAERATFRTPVGGQLDVDALRFASSAGAYRAYLWMRPSEAKTSPLCVCGVVKNGVTLAHYHNYILRMQGALPAGSMFQPMAAMLPDLDPVEASIGDGSNGTIRWDPAPARRTAGWILWVGVGLFALAIAGLVRRMRRA